MSIPPADGAASRAALFILVGAMLGGGRAWAETVDAPSLQLAAHGGLALRDDAFVDPDSDTHAQGQSASRLALSGRWFPNGRAIGVAGWLDATRLSLHTNDVRLGAGPGSVTAGSVAGAFAGRLTGTRGAQSWSFVGALGWSGMQLPLAAIQAGPLGARLAGDRLWAHGPLITAIAAWQPHRLFGVEIDGVLVPVTFGARVNEQSLDVRRWRLGAAAILGDVTVARSHLSAVLSFVHDDTHGTASGVHLTQASNELGLGLRACWWPRAASISVAAELRPAPAGRLTLLVRTRAPGSGNSDAVAAGVTGEIFAADGRRAGTFVTDEAGRASLVGLHPGPIEVRLRGDGWEPAREILSFPASGTATATVSIARLAPPARASVAVSGQVRAAGAAVAARVRLLELGVEQATGPDGGFHFDVPPGRYTLVVEAPGFVAQRKVLEAGRSEQQIYDLELAPQGR